MKLYDKIKIKTNRPFETMIFNLKENDFEDWFFDKDEILEGKFFGYPLKENVEDTTKINIETELYVIYGIDKEWFEVI
jgi:hypothetical protein